MSSTIFACFPVVLTFAAIGILALLIVATGMVGPGAGAESSEHQPATPTYERTGPPPWWVVVIIFLAVALAFLSLDWIGADWRPPGR